jgi:hypothetical protein
MDFGVTPGTWAKAQLKSAADIERAAKSLRITAPAPETTRD